MNETKKRFDNRWYSLCSHQRLLSGDAFSVYSTLGSTPISLQKIEGAKSVLLRSGQGRIRTAEAVKQQIYSLPVLTTYLPTRCIVRNSPYERVSLDCDAKLLLNSVTAKRNLPFLLQKAQIPYLCYQFCQPCVPKLVLRCLQ